MNSHALIIKSTKTCFLLGVIAIVTAGCATNIQQEESLRLPESTMAIREIQTRTFSAPSETDILAAAIALMQDMEFNIDRMEKALGVITASKISDADSSAEQTRLFMFDMFCMIGGSDCNARSTAQDEQRITLTMIVLPSLAMNGHYITRITIQRAIFDQTRRVKHMERIDDPQIYQEIFDNLAKAKYLQVNDHG